MLGVVAVNLDRLFQGLAAIPPCVQLDRDLSLAARRDLPRERGDDASSPPLDLLDVEFCLPFILNDKIMRYDDPFKYGIEGIGGFGEKDQ